MQAKAERCDACHMQWAKVWWITLPSHPADYGWLELSLCGHCTNLHAQALTDAQWMIAVDEREHDAYKVKAAA